jgi:hypothetical protein
MTGPEMMINSLIKLFKLEAYVDILRDQIKAAVDDGLVDKVKTGVDAIGTFDERLARIERKLGIVTTDASRTDAAGTDAGTTTEPGAGARLLDSPDLLNGDNSIQS